MVLFNFARRRRVLPYPNRLVGTCRRCFVGSHRTKAYYPGASENDTAFTDRYMMQLKEIVAKIIAR